MTPVPYHFAFAQSGWEKSACYLLVGKVSKRHLSRQSPLELVDYHLIRLLMTGILAVELWKKQLEHVGTVLKMGPALDSL